MNLNLKVIAILVILSLITIFGYQAYWLVKMYRSDRIQADTAIMLAIKNADHIELFTRVDSVSNATEKTRHTKMEGSVDSETENSLSYSISFKKDETSDSVTTNLEKSIQNDTVNHHSLEQKQKEAGEGDLKMGESFEALEKMAIQLQKGLHSAVDDITGGINLAKFDSILDAELQSAHLTICHYSQLVCLENDSVMNASLPENVDLSAFAVYEHIYDADDKYAYRVFVESLDLAILKQMAGILGSSLIILIILGISFGFLIRTIMQQKTLDEMKSDFTNNITHELKTPIAVAYAANDALLNFNQAEDKAKREKYLAISQEQLQKLSGLVEQILSMSMERRKGFHMNIEDIHVNALIRSLVEQHKLKADKEVVFDVKMGSDNIYVKTDRTHFSNIISNLIDNAIKYSKEQIVVTIEAHAKENRTEISVSDKGIGIPAEKQELIFDKFYRVPTGKLHDVKGYGLGLFYVKTMIEKLGGNISVVSEPGVGSTFHLTI